jgi:transposase
VPRRGDKGRDDRLFLEAIHYFSVHNISWRALPERFGKWNSVWKRFGRLSKVDVFETFFEHLAALSSSAHPIQMFDSTVVRAHVSAAGAKGGRTPRRSAVRAAVSPLKSPEDRLRRPSDRLRPDRRRTRRRTVLRHPARARPQCRSAGRRRRQGLCQQGQPAGGAVTRHRPRYSAKGQQKGKPGFFAKAIYKGRPRIEQAVGKLKRFKRVALECENTKRNFAAIVALAAGFILVKSVHTA